VASSYVPTIPAHAPRRWYSFSTYTLSIHHSPSVSSRCASGDWSSASPAGRPVRITVSSFPASPRTRPLGPMVAHASSSSCRDHWQLRSRKLPVPTAEEAVVVSVHDEVARHVARQGEVEAHVRDRRAGVQPPQPLRLRVRQHQPAEQRELGPAGPRELAVGCWRRHVVHHVEAVEAAVVGLVLGGAEEEAVAHGAGAGPGGEAVTSRTRASLSTGTPGARAASAGAWSSSA
jgi:hypothetical protein